MIGIDHLPRRSLAALGALCVALGVAACGGVEEGSSSSGSFTGAKKGPAEAISSFHSNATSANAKKVCEDDLSKAVLTRLESKGGSCVKAMEGQLGEIDTYNLEVESITVQGKQAMAKVKSVWNGKMRASVMSLTEEGGSWKVSGLSGPTS